MTVNGFVSSINNMYDVSPQETGEDENTDIDGYGGEKRAHFECGAELLGPLMHYECKDTDGWEHFGEVLDYCSSGIHNCGKRNHN